MRVPDGYTEAEVLAIFDKVIKKLAQKFTFGFREIEDIYQEGFILALKGLEKYDPGTKKKPRPLENFLYIHIRNRLCNYKRKHYMRLEKPCTRCPIKAFLPPEGCSKYQDRMDCKLYANWYNRNIVKRNLAHTLEYEQVDYTHEDNMKYTDSMINDIDRKEIIDLIDRELPVSLRKFFLQMLNGIKINKRDEEILKTTILEILKDNGYSTEE